MAEFLLMMTAFVTTFFVALLIARTLRTKGYGDKIDSVYERIIKVQNRIYYSIGHGINFNERIFGLKPPKYRKHNSK